MVGSVSDGPRGTGFFDLEKLKKPMQRSLKTSAMQAVIQEKLNGK